MVEYLICGNKNQFFKLQIKKIKKSNKEPLINMIDEMICSYFH